jgi:hypothetical protein
MKLNELAFNLSRIKTIHWSTLLPYFKGNLKWRRQP